MSWRDRLNRILDRARRQVVRRVLGTEREEGEQQEEAPAEQPRRPLTEILDRARKAVAAEEPEVVEQPPEPDEDSRRLLEQLEELTRASAEIRAQLQRRGLGKQAKAVAQRTPPTGGTVIATVVDPSDQPVEGAYVIIQLPEDRELEGVSDEDGIVIFEGVPPGRHTIIADAEDLQPDVQPLLVEVGKTTRIKLVLDFMPELPPEQRREAPSPWLRGTSLHIPYTVDLALAFEALHDMWDRARIGMTRDEAGPNPYAPNAIAKGGPHDMGIRVPGYALVSEEAFVSWARRAGYEGGLSIVIDGMVVGPGRSVIGPEPGKRS